jgi:lipopolysaccharide biosynthesis glycosyltransferase
MTNHKSPFRIFIGFDTSEVVAYHVCCQSIILKSSVPVSFTPLSLNLIKGIYNRTRDPLQSTDFSFSRFLVPYLSGYEGWSLFIDGDMLVRSDIAELIALCDDAYSAMTCQHDYIPNSSTKFLNNTQTKYVKKNWSSVILFNNSHCRNLTPDYVNTATGLELHQFKWLDDEKKIGNLPLTWNWLVGEYPFDDRVKLAHFTLGGPYFDEFAHADFSDEWRGTLSQVIYPRKIHRS